MSMKWIRLKNGSRLLEMSIINDPYPFYEGYISEESIARLDKHWTAASVRLTENGRMLYSVDHEEILKTSEVIEIMNALEEFLSGKLPEEKELSFYEPNIRFLFSADKVLIELYRTEIDDGKSHVTEGPFPFSLSREDVRCLCLYLCYTANRKASNDPDITDLMKKGVLYDEWRWYLTARVKGCKYRAYIFPVKEWYFDDSEHTIGAYFKYLKSERYTREGIYREYMYDFNVKKCYVPKILFQSSVFNYWGNTDKDYQLIRKYLEILNTEDLEYFELIQRLKALHETIPSENSNISPVLPSDRSIDRPD